MKLLQRTSRHYFILSIFLLLIAVPVFYVVIRAIVIEDHDESLIATKIALLPKIANALSASRGDVIFLDHDFSLKEASPGESFDSLSTVSFYNDISREVVPHRVLRSHVIINNRHFLLMVQSSMVDSDDLSRSILIVQVIVCMFLLGGLFLINRGLSKRIWLPFNNTLRQLREYDVDKNEPLKLDVSTVDEFNELNNSLVELTNRIHIAYTNQKEFTENASHEMQTPLAVLQAKLELLMQTNPLSEEQAVLLSDMADANQRIARLNRNLILLTKIDNNMVYGEVEMVSMSAVLHYVIRQYQSYIDEKEIRINVEISEDVSLAVNRSLLEILINNMLANAVRHNVSKGWIRVCLSDRKLIVENTGPPKALDEKNMFRRFYKDSTDSRSLGLGLEIVKKLCVIYKLELGYSYSEGVHRFTILIP